jgi:polyphosphate kinase
LVNPEQAPMAASSNSKEQSDTRPSSLSPDQLAKFDLDDPKLPDFIEDKALQSGNFPYDKTIKGKVYRERLGTLQYELVKLQYHIQKTGARIVALFEGRDSAGKGGCISRILEHLNPRHARSIALTKPTPTEQGQWYFQRYIDHLPTSGDIVLFDRSWYNRAGVERVMGFCTEDELANFLREAPDLEALLVRDGIHFLKFYLTIGQEMQLQRFHERRHNILKQWKLSSIDRKAMKMWDEYSQAEEDMFRFTHTATSPWTVIHANDQKRARLEAIKVLLSSIEYEGKDEDAIGEIDTKIVSSGPRQEA